MYIQPKYLVYIGNNCMIYRELTNKLIDQCFKGKIILLIGARQVGKTTILRALQKEIDVDSIWLNADETDILTEFNSADTSSRLLQLIGPNNKLVIIDEAQQIKDIGRKLKLIHDTNPEIQLIATGSSAFDLQNQASEPLTGRKRTFHLFPISYGELIMHTSAREAKRLLDVRLIYGSYPEVITNPSREKEVLSEIVNSYLYKDLLMLDGIRKSAHLQKLVQALAFQTGHEVNYHELAKTVGNINSATVEKYLDLLEKAFVIFKLPAFKRNLRNELKKGKKYYFYDNGIRNTIMNNFAPINLRLDKGALWENFMLSERLKYNTYQMNFPNTYFWRTHDQAEIDYLEERDGILHAYEIKWQKQKIRFPESFRKAYPDHKTHLINQNNFEDFIVLGTKQGSH